MAVLVATGLILLVQNRHDARQQSLAAQRSSGLEGRGLTGGHPGEERADGLISRSVVVREGRTRERSAVPRRPGIRVISHGTTLGDHNGVMPTARVHSSGLTLTTLAVVALNLRVALTSLPTVETEIQQATGWSNAGVGMLTTIPILCMGVFALAVPWAARRIGRRATVAAALLLLLVAMGSRLLGSLPAVLTISVFLAGIGIALAMGLVPVLVRAQVPAQVGTATGIWTGAMMLGAAAGGALTAPLAGLLGSWELALAVWALPAAAGLAFWLRVEGLRDETGDPAPASVHIRTLPWRSRTAWALTTFIMLNSLMFYTSVAWMAPSFVDRGWTQDDAGFLFGAFTVGQLVGAVLMPIVADRISARRALFAALVLACALTAFGLGVTDSGLAVLIAIVFGFGLGGAFTMALALLSEFGRDGHASGRLTAMAFFVTYLVAAVGPLAAGALVDTGVAWAAIFALIALAGLGQFVSVPALRRGSVVE